MKTKSAWRFAVGLRIGLGILCLVGVTCSRAGATAGCIGDCNGDDSVTIDELLRGRDIALGLAGAESCLFADPDQDGEVTSGELIVSIRSSWTGSCYLPPVAAPDPGAHARLAVGTVHTAPGDSGMLAVTVESSAQALAGTIVDLTFDPTVAVAAGRRGRPDCVLGATISPEPDLGEVAGTFIFTPTGCVPGTSCVGLRALSIANVPPQIVTIADGAVLFSCRFEVAAGAGVGSHPLGCSVLNGADPVGASVDTTCSAGEVIVDLHTPTATSTATPTPTPTAALRLEVGHISGSAGQIAELAVVLRAGGESVAATQNDLSFDPETPVRIVNGRPDCEVNSALGKDDSQIVFMPVGCRPGINCSAVRVLVFSSQNVDVLTDNITLYTCRVQIGAASLGDHPVGCSDAGASGPAGEQLTPGCSNGNVAVLALACVGDCDGGGTVTVNELVTGVAIALGTVPLTQCGDFDRSGDGAVGVDELIQAVSAALAGCG